MSTDLNALLSIWVANVANNGIKQHSAEWHTARKYVIGGSSIGVIMEINPYNTIYELISERVGLNSTESNIKMLWGNVFERNIREYVSVDKQCIILGDDLFICSADNLAYSPDGLAVMDLDYKGVKEQHIVLCEFKCPFSRIPAKTLMKSYVSQVKMGLELLQLPTIGLLVEAVYRRCCWNQLKFNGECDKSMSPKLITENPLAIGFIGFYCVNMELLKINYPNIYKLVRKNPLDLGAESIEDLYEVFRGIESKDILLWHSKQSKMSDKDQINFNIVLDEYTNYCEKISARNIGVLSWKLFQVKYTIIEKEENYLAPWLSKIKEVIDTIRLCDGIPLSQKKRMVDYCVNKIYS